MGFTQTWRQEWYTGTAAALSGPAVTKYDVVVNGHGYMLDLDNPKAAPYKFESVPMLRAMFLQDRGTAPIGEHSLNPDDYWRRSVDDWSHGAGQTYLDHADSDGSRFNTSKGCDPWTKGRIGLLHDTALNSAADTSQAVVCGDSLYLLANVSSLDSLSIIGTGLVTADASDDALSAATGIATDGFTVWVCDSTRVHYTTRGDGLHFPYHTADHVATLIASAKGRLFTANGTSLYTHSGAAGSAVATEYFTPNNVDWTWTAVEGGPDSIYFAGYAGTHSLIYGATIKSDGTDLDAPVVVATLPVGERVLSMQAYFSVLLIGTDKGWRAAALNNGGSLTLGSLVAMNAGPTCWEVQDRFAWFGWTNYDTTTTGLGRIDLSVFNNDVPAYASDLMYADQGAVTSIVTFGGIRYFTVTGVGLVNELTTNVVSGTVSSGLLNYELADSKLAIKLVVQNSAGGGSYQASLSVDQQAAVDVGALVLTSPIRGASNSIGLPQRQGRAFETTFTLNDDLVTPGTGPVLDRHTLMVEPQPERRTMFTVPLRLHGTVRDRLQNLVYYSAAEERRRFYLLMRSRSVVPFQDVEQNWQVLVDDFTWVPYEQITDHWDGTLMVQLKVVD